MLLDGPPAFLRVPLHAELLLLFDLRLGGIGAHLLGDGLRVENLAAKHVNPLP